MKKWIIVVSVIVVLVFCFFIYGLFNPVKGTSKCAGFGCGGPPPECSALPDTTCKAQCDDATEQKIDGPFCETENFVCCQKRPAVPLN